MSAKKKHKKRAKLSRRVRQTSGVRARPTEAAAITEEHKPEPPQTTPVAAPPKPAAVTFQTATSRGPDGIDEELTKIEYPAVRRDLKRLGVTILAFAAILAGLTVLGNQTDVIDRLGHELFKVWQ